MQGVGYRWWTQAQARALGLRGWVRNCSDGSVEAMLAGTKADVEAMIRRMRDGPSLAQVERIEIQPSERAAPADFEIRR